MKPAGDLMRAVGDPADRLSSDLAGYNTPRQVHFLAEFPRTAVGKIQKHVLRERFGA